MPLLGADQFRSVLDAYRICWIGGRFGGHKSAVSLALARPYLERGYRLVTNLSCVWADDLDDIKFINEPWDDLPDLSFIDTLSPAVRQLVKYTDMLDGNLNSGDSRLRVVAILDEGGLEVKHTSQVEAMTAYARKMDCIYLYPSFFPPNAAARVVSLQPLFSFMPIGLPMVWYRYQVTLGGFREEGSFAWWNPREIYGLYSSNNPGASLDTIINWFVAKTYEFQSYYGSAEGRTAKNSVSEVAIVEHLSEVSDALSVAAAEISFSSRKDKRDRR